MSAMRRAVACVAVLAFVAGKGFAAQAPPRILIVADDLTLQFCSTPRVRELMRRALRVLRRDGNLVAIASTGFSGVAVQLSVDLIGLDSAISKVVGGGLSSRG